MPSPLLLAKNDKKELALLPGLANRHGLITGATGTGKTVTLQALAQRFSAIGVPVFMADVKGDFSGIAKAGGSNPKVLERFKTLKTKPELAGCPVEFWDVYGASGLPVRATVSDMGPLLLGRMLGLNETQEGVLGLVFKIADDHGLLLLDLKDLRAMLQHVGDSAKSFTTQYGNVSVASIGAIQRGLLTLEQQGAERFFGEPMLNLDDVLAAARRLPDLGITHRRTTISTVGWLPGLRRFVDEVDEPIRLALSLHAADPALRSELMPVNDRYPLRDVVAECERYFELRRRKVFVEYVMLAGVNDRVEQARQLAELLDPHVFKVNLIPYNPTGRFDGSSRKAIDAFKQVLDRARIPVTVRLTRGRDIEAACGQLAAASR